MNTNIRSTLSISTALGLVSFTVTSAFVSGVVAPATLISFGLLAVYGLLEIAALSYQTPRLFSSAPTASKAARAATSKHTAIPFPMSKRQELARAA